MLKKLILIATFLLSVPVLAQSPEALAPTNEKLIEVATTTIQTVEEDAKRSTQVEEEIVKQYIEPTEKSYRITGYNLFPEQTDSTPCIGASGKNLCVINYPNAACPRSMPLGTRVKIQDVVYICEDRLALKYDNRIDINCKFDTKCPYDVTGYFTVEILT